MALGVVNRAAPTLVVFYLGMMLFQTATICMIAHLDDEFSPVYAMMFTCAILAVAPDEIMNMIDVVYFCLCGEKKKKKDAVPTSEEWHSRFQNDPAFSKELKERMSDYFWSKGKRHPEMKHFFEEYIKRKEKEDTQGWNPRIDPCPEKRRAMDKEYRHRGILERHGFRVRTCEEDTGHTMDHWMMQYVADETTDEASRTKMAACFLSSGIEYPEMQEVLVMYILSK